MTKKITSIEQLSVGMRVRQVLYLHEPEKPECIITGISSNNVHHIHDGRNVHNVIGFEPGVFEYMSLSRDWDE